jgi:hypothetical protein
MSQDFNRGFGSCFQPGAGYPAVTADSSFTSEEAESLDQESLRDEEATLDAEGSLDAEATLDAERSLTLSPAALEERAAARLKAAREFHLDMELARFIRSAGGNRKPGSWVRVSSPLIK